VESTFFNEVISEVSAMRGLIFGPSPFLIYQRSSIIYHLTHRSCLGGVKVCHKRQALQDMARPLKQWLYKHKDNPYPTKTEKVLLALGSRMTLVQVSNWFANARRRLKNTVSQPDLSWALRIKLYNKYIQGNAERMSVSSEDTNSEASQSELSRPSLKSAIKQENGTHPAFSDDYVSPPPKYKSSLLNRYLNDTLRHVMATPDDVTKSHPRNHSGSFSSNECDDDLVSPSSSEAEANSLYHMGKRCKSLSRMAQLSPASSCTLLFCVNCLPFDCLFS
uniref:Mohawk homeobox b n=1 Tax=Salmo trutta TaxID=8032 RepID=A0A674DXK3_SALTR